MSGWGTVPDLSGKHVALRSLRPSDWRALAEAHDGPDILEFFPYGPQSLPPTAESVAQACDDPGRQPLAQIDQSSGRIVGTTSVYHVDEGRRTLTVGYTWLSEAVRGRALNAEAKLLLFRFAFRELRAVRVQLYVDDRNERSLRAVAALGAHEEGRLRKHARRRDGSWRRTVVFSILDDEWDDVERHLEGLVRARG